MKKRVTWFGIIAAFIISFSTFFVGCNKDDMNDVIVYKGQVVYINTTTPFPDLTVKVTNGKDTYTEYAKRYFIGNHAMCRADDGAAECV